MAKRNKIVSSLPANEVILGLFGKQTNIFPLKTLKETTGLANATLESVCEHLVRKQPLKSEGLTFHLTGNKANRQLCLRANRAKTRQRFEPASFPLEEALGYLE
jgi:hypothetical protein